LYEDNEARTVGYVTARAESIAGFNGAKTAILADTDLATAIGGDAVTLRCHDANGEVYYVAFSRTQVTVSPYADDAILTRIETWADTKPVLA
jgi:hypothetical protein